MNCPNSAPTSTCKNNFHVVSFLKTIIWKPTNIICIIETTSPTRSVNAFAIAWLNASKGANPIEATICNPIPNAANNRATINTINLRKVDIYFLLTFNINQYPLANIHFCVLFV